MLKLLIGVMVLFLVACDVENKSEEITQESPLAGITDLSFDETKTLTATNTTTLHTELFIEDNSSDYTLEYYLISHESEQLVEGDEENISITTYTPNAQYHLATINRTFTEDENSFDLNITLPEIEDDANYYLVASLQKKGYKQLHSSDDTYTYSTHSYLVHSTKEHADLVIDEVKTDEVLLIENRETALLLSMVMTLHSHYKMANDTKLSSYLEVDNKRYDLTHTLKPFGVTRHSMHVSVELF
jgi:hypothetical protein